MMIKHRLTTLTSVQEILKDSVMTGQLLRCGLIEDEMKGLPSRLDILTQADLVARPQRLLPTLFEDQFWYQLVLGKILIDVLDSTFFPE
jgi:hypothetical protein